MKIKSKDQVIVLSGKDKGKTGTVLEVIPKKSQVLVEGVNIYKRHRKGMRKEDSGIIELTKPIHVSNVALVDPKTKNPTRIGFQISKNGDKKRITRKSSSLV